MFVFFPNFPKNFTGGIERGGGEKFLFFFLSFFFPFLPSPFWFVFVWEGERGIFSLQFLRKKKLDLENKNPKIRVLEGGGVFILIFFYPNFSFISPNF